MSLVHTHTHHAQDYLLKMFSDLDFVNEGLGPEAASLANFCKGNPLLLTEEEIQGRGVRSTLGRVHAAGACVRLWRWCACGGGWRHIQGVLAVVTIGRVDLMTFNKPGMPGSLAGFHSMPEFGPHQPTPRRPR
jgi:hypothetical protein